MSLANQYAISEILRFPEASGTKKPTKIYMNQKFSIQKIN